MIVTGIQPTGYGHGSIHIGNYLGAIKPLIVLQRPAVGSVVFIADYHAITMGHDPATLREDIYKLAAMLLASGVDKMTLFKQSMVPAHTELSWILMCTAARTGWLNRMVQFKEKSESLGENSEGPSVGLYGYPVLQAADILSYQADEVPVGEDQLQHLNLTVDIAQKFNRDFGNVFTIPKAVVQRDVKRIMSLTEPTKKMSKSEPNANSRINLDDDADTISAKIKRATSDQGMISAEFEDRPGLKNLLTIYATFAGITVEQAAERFDGKGYGALKPALAEVLIEGLQPIRTEYLKLMGERGYIAGVLSLGAEVASITADKTLLAVKQAIGVSNARL